jgi:hypothetical protein
MDDVGWFLIFLGLAYILCDAGAITENFRWAISGGCILLGAILITLDRLTSGRKSK